MAELTIGIAGLGRWGRNYLATLTRIPGCRVVAVADPAIPKVGGLAVSRTGQEMLNHEPLDAVVIATPERTHYALARAALDSGRHVLVEKPMALDLAEAIHLSELAARSHLVLEIGHTALYSPGFNRLHKAVRRGQLGTITKMKAYRTSTGPSGKPSVVGNSFNPIWDLAVHDLAMAILLLGQPLSGSARNRSNQDIS
ncbi:MAG: Gfo/Idh/MocA family oxidoreductase, partial [candidate division WOR-3 bacterium]